MSNGSEHIPEKIPTAFGMVTPASKPFAPGEWMREWADRLEARQRQMIRNSYIMQGIDPDNRPEITERRPLDPAFIEARAEFAKRWEELVAEGEAAGYLGRDHCYECGGELAISTHTTEAIRVPNPDFDPDKPNPYAQDPTVDDVLIVPVVQHDAIHIGGDCG
ncbi:hypothetical protein [Leifsonia sp. TF02-11]|uniref:hypothetical protein n=1 Tax=Leifsonia sp. TF02-11 TaxID=2815212 RepID=UPI001AA0C4AC|nr:hypothetical protein [Leifsonia sp. TF02-11]MBO1739686.1 hypothetical protein [Leifsonia sp. TF02-11]